MGLGNGHFHGGRRRALPPSYSLINTGYLLKTQALKVQWERFSFSNMVDSKRKGGDFLPLDPPEGWGLLGMSETLFILELFPGAGPGPALSSPSAALPFLPRVHRLSPCVENKFVKDK